LLFLLLTYLMASDGYTVMYVGSFTGNEISVFFVQRNSLLLTSTAISGFTPTWLTYYSNVLYATSEQAGFLAALRVNQNDGTLTYTNRVSTSGNAPTYVTVAPAGNFVLAANYDTGSVVVIATHDGIFGERSDFQQHNGTGPVPGRQTGPHAHQIIFDATGKFVYSPDLGADKVYQYRWNSLSGVLIPLAVPFVSSEPGDGPRHLTFSPNGNFAYLACELSSVVIVYRVDQTTGELKQIQRVKTLQPPYDVNNFPAEVIVAPSGNFVYVSNRGNNSISIFNSTAGTIDLIGVHLVNGAYPRGMVFDADANIIYTMNQNSGTITSHEVHPDTGLLTFLGVSATGLNTPVCGYILKLK